MDSTDTEYRTTDQIKVELLIVALPEPNGTAEQCSGKDKEKAGASPGAAWWAEGASGVVVH